MLAEGNNAWLKLQQDGKIYGSVITNGANTGRCTHQNQMLHKLPAVGVPYGKECRSLFTVPDGYVLIGCDASGLELRCLAHYLGAFDGGFCEANYLMVIFIPKSKTDWLTNERFGKRVIYGVIYGIGDTRLGSIVNKTSYEEKNKSKII